MFAAVACTVERAFGGVKYVYRGIKREDGNSHQESGYPVVLIIPGSGPTDMDGNSAALPGKNNSLKYLAEGLAGKGIASLRYDKRGIASSASAGKDESVSYTHLDVYKRQGRI